MNRFYSCPKCKALLCIESTTWTKNIKCTKCGESMIYLNDEFDLSDVIYDGGENVEQSE